MQLLDRYTYATSSGRPSFLESQRPRKDRRLPSERSSGTSSPSILGAAAVATASSTAQRITDPSREDPFTKLYLRLSSIAKLRRNWNSYGAEPPNRWSTFWTRRILHALSLANFPPSNVTASSDEGIAFFFRSGSKRASIECLNTEEIVAVVSDANQTPKVWFICPDEKEIAREIGVMQKFLTK